MFSILAHSVIELGNRIQNYGYCLSNPSYLKVRSGKGCADIYRLLNKSWFPKDEIELVLDVGANEGQFINTSLALMPSIPVYAFEPNPKLVKILCSKYTNLDVKIFPFALGESPCQASFNVSKFSPSSSFLKANDQLTAEFPGLTVEEVVKVEIKRLDNLLINGAAKDFLLKIDVQGFEMDVLRGAVGVLEHALVVVCEVNFASLYEDQCTFEEIISFLRTYGLYLVDIGQPIRSRHNQEVLYLDLAFLKK
ncbi:FkbM family methyltransferase [Nodosilinea nodulosa]|uniref:FkbM family methyltransferase n=1 Tax=Nodosilinea nodulosa TaxID=416001 RepID=UPI00036F79DA|nr:FkbM family methyltransferase [Nodosilinea nodulosa]